MLKVAAQQQSEARKKVSVKKNRGEEGSTSEDSCGEEIGGKKYIADNTYVVGLNNQIDSSYVDLLSAS